MMLMRLRVLKTTICISLALLFACNEGMNDRSQLDTQHDTSAPITAQETSDSAIETGNVFDALENIRPLQWIRDFDNTCTPGNRPSCETCNTDKSLHYGTYHFWSKGDANSRPMPAMEVIVSYKQTPWWGDDTTQMLFKALVLSNEHEFQGLPGIINQQVNNIQSILKDTIRVDNFIFGRTKSLGICLNEKDGVVLYYCFWFCPKSIEDQNCRESTIDWMTATYESYLNMSKR